MIANAAHAADELEATRSLAKIGAVQLALHRVDRLQPAAATAPLQRGVPGWTEWERLRLQLLVTRGAHDVLLQRIAGMPAGIDAAVAADFHAAGSHSALITGRGAVARDHAASALWASGAGTGTDAARLRELRLLVIRSLINDGQADDAYRSMLRFQQDYRPLDRAVATQFVDGLLDLKRVKEAVIWLGFLDERGATKLRLRLHTGLLSPADVITQARAGIARSEDPAWWRILREAGEQQPAAALKIEALEQLLDRTDASAADASRLWEAYLAFARNAANTHQLLAGDEASWLEFALKRKETEPVVARAYLAYLAREGRAESLRRTAQSELASSLMAARLRHAALQVFSAWPGNPAALAAEVRYQLGGVAEALQQHVHALQFRQGLPAPDGAASVASVIWDLRMAGLALRAGRGEIVAGITRKLAMADTPIPAEQLPEWIGLAAQLADHGRTADTQLLVGRLMPFADSTQRHLLLAATVRALESASQPLLAAEYHLRLVMSAPQSDVSAEARLRAAFNLARGGLHDDARMQFEWLLKNARDPAQIAVARRELGF